MNLAKDDPVHIWDALTLVVGLITGFIGGWATLRAANPRRHLAYWMPTVTRMLNTSDSVVDLVVMRGGQTLHSPHVLDVRLMNRGRRDVASSHFDRGLPIRLDVGAPIVEILGISSFPDSLRPPVADIDDTALTVAPGLIAKGQMIHFSLLVDGPDPHLTCQAALIDVTVQERRDPSPRDRTLPRVMAIAAGGSVFVFLMAFTVVIPSGSVFDAYTFVLIFTVLVAFDVWGVAKAWTLRERSRRSSRRN